LLDLGLGLPADVDPEHVHAWLRGSVELQCADNRRSRGGHEDDADENDPSLHLQQ
jgi:hypothetical protein